MPLGTYIKARLFEGLPAVSRQRLTPKTDRILLTKLLGALGQSELPSNMSKIAKAAKIGALPVTSDLEQALKVACADIAFMRERLMKSLGLKA